MRLKISYSVGYVKFMHYYEGNIFIEPVKGDWNLHLLSHTLSIKIDWAPTKGSSYQMLWINGIWIHHRYRMTFRYNLILIFAVFFLGQFWPIHFNHCMNWWFMQIKSMDFKRNLLIYSVHMSFPTHFKREEKMQISDRNHLTP